MTNEELERAAERLADVEAVLGQGQGGIARDTDFARRVASDLRALLAERAELLAAVERKRQRGRGSWTFVSLSTSTASPKE